MKVYDLQRELYQTCGVFGRQKETNLIFEGENAYTDGKTIVIPAIPEDAEVSDTTARIIRGYVDHEAGHIRHTDFPLWIGTCEKGISPALKELWNSTEDIYLEEKVISEYPGAEKNLKELCNDVWVKEYDFITKEDDPTIINASNLGCATRVLGRNRHEVDSKHKLLGVFPKETLKWAEYFAERAKVAKGTAETFQIALDMAKILKDDPKLESDPPPPEQGLDGQPTEGQGPKNSQEAKEAAEAAGEGGEGMSKQDAEKEVYGGKPVKGEGKYSYVDKYMDPTKEIMKDIAGGSGKTFKLSPLDGEKPYKVTSTKGDETIHRLSPAPKNGNRIHEKMRTTPPSKYEKIKSDIGGHANTMKSKLRRSLAAMEQRDWDGGRIFGKLDSKRLVSAYNGAENVFKRRSDRLELDTSVHMLIDLSGSMSGEKMKVAAECAIAFAECLEGSPIRYQVSGFSNNGTCGARISDYSSRYEALQTYVFKGFNESLHAAKASMAVLPHAAGGNNSDRDAILWAYNELMLQPSKRKVLMVFSDGQPANATQGVGYEHLNFHTKEIIKQLEGKVEVIGIGILTNHLKEFYSNFVEIRNLGDLSGAMFNKLSNALIKGRVKL